MRAVGGQRQLVEDAGLEVARKRADKRHDAAPHQRLAAGQAELAHALGDEHAAEPVELFKAQKIDFG